MPFYAHPDGVNRPTPGPGAVKIPQRKWPPGYVDPPGVQRLRALYLARWEAQGKVIDKFARARALANARKLYYCPNFPRYQMSRKRYLIRQKNRLSGHYKRLSELGRAAKQRKREVKAVQAALEAQGKLVQRQFQLPVG